jgi:16S rRNA (guanine527-N7)-methyltransferase
LTLPTTAKKKPTLTTELSLLTVLERARTVGFLGPGPLRVHIEHARRYEARLASSARHLIDLGSGGGLPGLPLLLARPDMTGVLLDAAAKRTAFLVWASVELGIADRVEVVTARAEVAAHQGELRGAFDVAVCRGFGPPAITLECSAGYVAEGGQVLISEPPVRREWNNAELESVGLRHASTSDGVAEFRRVGPIPSGTPRTAKQMQRRPLEVEAPSDL